MSVIASEKGKSEEKYFLNEPRTTQELILDHVINYDTKSRKHIDNKSRKNFEIKGSIKSSKSSIIARTFKPLKEES